MSKVAAIVLAAGASTRLGEPKQLVMLGGERLLERAVRIAKEAGCTPLVVVLGATEELIRNQCPLTHCIVVANSRWNEGMASSLGAGLSVLPTDVEAAVVMTCDQPAVTVAHLRRLIVVGEAHRFGEAVCSTYAGRRGVPVFWPRILFWKLVALSGDEGAKSLLESAETVALTGGELDIDTQEMLRMAVERYER